MVGHLVPEHWLNLLDLLEIVDLLLAQSCHPTFNDSGSSQSSVSTLFITPKFHYLVPCTYAKVNSSVSYILHACMLA